VTARCEFAQGYYFSRPVPADEAEKMLVGGGEVTRQSPS